MLNPKRCALLVSMGSIEILVLSVAFVYDQYDGT